MATQRKADQPEEVKELGTAGQLRMLLRADVVSSDYDQPVPIF